MSNVVSINLNRATLSEMAEYVVSLDDSTALNCWHIAETLSQAKEVCEDDGVAWKEWVSEEIGYNSDHADRYVRVYTALPTRGAELAEKGCSFNTLLALSARDLPKADRKRLIDKMVKKVRIDQAYGVGIQKEVRAALPAPKLVLSEVSVEFSYPPFSVRLNEMLQDEFMSPEKAARLFGMSIKAHVDDIKIITRHWKQKYHPDKGGSKEEYQKICRAEEVFYDSQSEKEVAA